MAQPNGATDNLSFDDEGKPAPKAKTPTPEEQRNAATKQLAEMIGAAVSQSLAPIRQELLEMRGGPPPVDAAAEDDLSPQAYYRDPIGVTRKLIQKEGLQLFREQGGVAADLAVRTATDRAIEKISASDPVAWKALEADFRRESSRVPPERLAQVDQNSGESGAEQFFYYMKGRPAFSRKVKDAEAAAAADADKAQKDATRYPRAPYVEVGGARQGGAPITAKGLSTEQLNVADKMGLSPDQYAQSLRSIESGEPLAFKKPKPPVATSETSDETS